MTRANRLTELLDEPFSRPAPPFLSWIIARPAAMIGPTAGKKKTSAKNDTPKDAAQSPGAHKLAGVPYPWLARLAEQHLRRVPELQDRRPLHVGKTLTKDLSLGFGVEAERDQLAHAHHPF